jgi:hypothetical protein
MSIEGTTTTATIGNAALTEEREDTIPYRALVNTMENAWSQHQGERLGVNEMTCPRKRSSLMSALVGPLPYILWLAAALGLSIVVLAKLRMSLLSHQRWAKGLAGAWVSHAAREAFAQYSSSAGRHRTPQIGGRRRVPGISVSAMSL